MIINMKRKNDYEGILIYEYFISFSKNRYLINLLSKLIKFDFYLLLKKKL